MKHVLENILKFNMTSFLKFYDCMHIIFFSQANPQNGQTNFHHNLNLDVKKSLLFMHGVCHIFGILIMKEKIVFSFELLGPSGHLLGLLNLLKKLPEIT